MATALVAFFLLCCGRGTGNAAPVISGGKLFRKHCSSCHPHALGARPAGKVAATVRTPPPGMPVFGRDKLSDREAYAIGAYIEAGAPPEPAVPEPTALEKEAVEIPQAVAAPVPPPARIEPTSSHRTVAAERPHRSTKPSRSVRPERPKRSKVSGFEGNWTIKGKRNGETVTLQQLSISEKTRNELLVVPANSLSNYTVRVTKTEFRDGTLKIELTWGWSGSPEYWKIDTYELRLAENGKQMTGSHRTRTSGGKNDTGPVWAE